MEPNEKIDAYLAGELEGEVLKEFEAQLVADPQMAKEVKFRQDQAQKIDMYVSGELSREDHQRFEEEIATNPQLAKKVEFARDMFFFIENKERIKEFHSQLQKVREKVVADREAKTSSEPVDLKTQERNAPLPEQRRTPNIFTRKRKALEGLRSRWIWYTGIAAVILIFGLTTLFLLENSKGNYQQLYAEYYAPYPSPSTRGNNSGRDYVEEFSNLYKEKDYYQALDVLEHLIIPDTSSGEWKLYKGNIYIEVDSLDKAISTLNELKGTQFEAEAYWYTALAYLKKEDCQMTVKSLQAVIEIEEEYSISAANLLKELTCF